MNIPSHAPASAAGTSAETENENGGTQAVRTQKPSSSNLTHAVGTLKGNVSSKIQDESVSLSGELQAVSDASRTEIYSSQATNGKPPSSPPKFTQQSQDQVVSSESRTDNQVITSENYHVPTTGHDRDSIAKDQQSNVDVRNPNEDVTPLNAQIPINAENLGASEAAGSLELQHSMIENSRTHALVAVAGPSLDEQVVRASSSPLQQVNISDSTLIVNEVNFASQIISGPTHQSVQLGDSASLRHTPIVEGIPVIKGVPAGDTAPSAAAPSTIESVTQSQVSLLQPMVAPQGVTVVGMVGTTPIVRLPDLSKNVVTKKRGRFKVFPPVIDVAPIDSTSSSQNLTTGTPAGIILVNDPDVNVARTHDATFETGPSVATQSNQSALPVNNQEKPQTFEGTGDPVVKRKGRFFVTNLKDPGLIPMQVVNGVPTSALPGNQATVESYQVTSTYVQNSSPAVVVAPDPSDAHAAAMVAPSSTVPMLQQNQSQPRVQYNHLTVQQDHPAVYIQEPYYLIQNARYAAETQQSGVSQPSAILPTGIDATNYHSQAEPTEPKVPGAPERADHAADRLKDQAEVAYNHKPQARRHQSVPKSERDEHIAPSGLGKVFHFLDQMRTEVAQADKMIKTLQADTRLLKEKNKELEAKATDAERRFREEKALREATDAKLKALRKKVRSMREGSDAKKEDTSNLESAKRSEVTEPGHTHASPGAIEGSSVHSTNTQRNKSPDHDRTNKGNAESHSVPATPDATKKTKSASPENLTIQNVPVKALPPTPPARRKGSSSSNVPVPKPSPGHRSVKSTPHIPSPTGLFNSSFSNQMQSRNVDVSTAQHTTHVPNMTGSAQKDIGAQHFASTNFDPLAPEKSITLDQDTVAPTENPQNNFDPFSSAVPPLQSRGTGLQHNQATAPHVMQPAALFAKNHNNMAVPVYGLPGSSFEMMQNQPRMQAFDRSQVSASSSSVYEMQQHMIQQNNYHESHQSGIHVPQQALDAHVEQSMSTPGLWSQQQQGSIMRTDMQLMPDGGPAVSFQSKSSDPFDELLNRATQS